MSRPALGSPDRSGRLSQLSESADNATAVSYATAGSIELVKVEPLAGRRGGGQRRSVARPPARVVQRSLTLAGQKVAVDQDDLPKLPVDLTKQLATWG